MCYINCFLGERDRETATCFLTASLGREKRAGVGGACFLKEPLHLCRVRILLAMWRGVTYCARFPSGRAEVCLHAKFLPVLIKILRHLTEEERLTLKVISTFLKSEVLDWLEMKKPTWAFTSFWILTEDIQWHQLSQAPVFMTFPQW